MYATAISPEVAVAGELLAHIKKGELGTEFAGRDVQRKGWIGLNTAETVAAALDVLLDFGWLKTVHDARTGGRPRMRYLVNPIETTEGRVSDEDA